jgi:hypothetical protein
MRKRAASCRRSDLEGGSEIRSATTSGCSTGAEQSGAESMISPSPLALTTHEMDPIVKI